MSSVPVFEEWEPCAPMFVESGDGFVLSDEAQLWLDPPPPTVAARLLAVQRELAALAMEMPSAARSMEPHDLVDALDVLQRATNRVAAVEQAVVAEVDRSRVAETFGATSTAVLLSQQLRITPAEANRRVRLARTCAERVDLLGQVQPPVCPQVAAAQAAGDISPQHASLIARTLDHLPASTAVEVSDEVEQALVEYAGKDNPTGLAALCREVVDRFDPDGPKPREAEHRRRREVRLSQLKSGMGSLGGDFTAILLAKLQAVLSPLAAPRPADGNGEDTRTPGQRLHDALEDVCDRLLHSGTLPESGGVPASIAVTMSLAALERRAGHVRTGFGTTMSIAQLLHAACEAELIPVVFNDAGGVMAYGQTKRFATPGQRKALRARDKGCSFPRCTRPPEWCEAHHVREWLQDLGPTDIDNLTLLCGHHHRSFETWGWSVQMVDGVPWWTPPAHLDPEQKPVRNHAHDRPDLDARFAR